MKRQGLYRCTLSTQHSPSARSIPEVLAALPGRLGPGARTPQPVLDLPALDRQIGAFITTYNDRTHSELGISPRDAWVSDGWLPRMPETLEELDGLLLTVPKIRVVQRDGIHFPGQRYPSPTLAPFVGRTITIRYDPRDISEIGVYDRDTDDVIEAAASTFAIGN